MHIFSINLNKIREILEILCKIYELFLLIFKLTL